MQHAGGNCNGAPTGRLQQVPTSYAGVNFNGRQHGIWVRIPTGGNAACGAEIAMDAKPACGWEL